MTFEDENLTRAAESESRGVFQPAEGRKNPEVFGRILKRWLEKSGKTQNTLAIKLDVDPSQVSKWVAGERCPNREKVTRALIYFYRWLEEDWQVPEALDGIIWLGLVWEDVAVSLKEDSHPDGISNSFRSWWEEGRPQKQASSIGFMPGAYVEPEQLADLRLLVTGMRGYRQPAFNGVVVRGVSGAGKTILARALAMSEVIDWDFRDGIVWVDGKTADLSAKIRRKIDWDDEDEEDEEDWKEWIGSVNRRLLIIIDDLADKNRLRDFLGRAGPQVTVLVTTQKGEDILEEMKRRSGHKRLAEVEVTGLSKRNAWELVEKIFGRELEKAERGLVEEVGEILGWHPEGLRLAAEKAWDETWSGVLSDLRNVEESSVLLTLEDWIGRHWQRMKQQDREQARRLLDRMEEGWPFGVWFASAAWDIGPDEARTRLSRLERQGLIERLEAGHKLPWQGEDKGYEQWRPLPLVYKVIAKRSNGKLDQGARGLRRYFWRWRERLLGFYRSGEAPNPPSAPLVFGLVAVAWSVPFSVVKSVVYVVLLLLGVLFPGRRWARRWSDWSIVMAAEDHLTAHWERQATQLTEEFWMIYRGKDFLAQLMPIVLAIIAVLLSFHSPGVFLALWLVALLWVAVGYFSWFMWLAALYGVHTWDLELMLRVSLWLTRWLSWIPALRENQDALREALERVREGREE